LYLGVDLGLVDRFNDASGQTTLAHSRRVSDLSGQLARHLDWESSWGAEAVLGMLGMLGQKLPVWGHFSRWPSPACSGMSSSPL